MNRKIILAAAPWLMVSLFLGPVFMGLLGTLLPAIGYFPALGLTELSWQPLHDFYQYPGVGRAFTLSFTTGFLSSLFALAITLTILVGLYPSSFIKKIERALAPILSIPHAAFAIGFGFLITPSGWLFRVIHELTGLFEQPLVMTTLQDSNGFSLLIILMLKEIPFLLFMALATLPSLSVSRTLWLGASLGYSRVFTWLWLITPQLYTHLRLPFYSILVYSLSVVDISIIAGPTAPPTAAVVITRLFTEADLTNRLLGAVGACHLLVFILVSLALVRLVEKALAYLRRYILLAGVRFQGSNKPIKVLAISLLFGLMASYIFSFFVTALWSISKRWRYPDLFPEGVTSASWYRSIDRLSDTLLSTLGLASVAAIIAVVLCIFVLESEVRLHYKGNHKIKINRLLFLIYMPLLVPQVAFLFGFQVTLIYFKLDGAWVSVLWSHLIFVIPYVFLTLSEPYRNFDERYMHLAKTLSKRQFKPFVSIKLIMLLRPILYSLAIGFSVSIAQYLPTLFIGAGHLSTVTTEAVAMASGSNRSMMAVMAMWQQLLPFAVFSLVMIISTIRFRAHRLMSH